MADHAYLTLKLAGELCGKSPGALAPDERQRVDGAARRQREIEARILAAPEAAAVCLPPAAVARTLAEIRGRYPGDEDYLADLARNGLTPADLRDAVARDLMVEAVLEGVASRIGSVSDQDLEIFYLLHRDRFRRPEGRRLRHVLVTINEDSPGSSRPVAQARIEAVRQRLLREPGRFAEQALKHSECPTALNGGLLGEVVRGQLYPALEPAAFSLAVGQISPVLESPLGFHVFLCEAVRAEEILPLATVRESLRASLVDSRRQRAQKAWIAGLFRERTAA